MGSGTDGQRGGFATPKLARADQHREAVAGEAPRDFQANSLVGARNECDRFIMHAVFSYESK